MRRTPHGGNIFAIARDLGLAPSELVDFSASINPLGPPEKTREAVAAAFDLVVHYPDSHSTDLCGDLTRHHRLDPGNICVANGSTELIYLLPRLVAGRHALIIAPPFSEYAGALLRDGWCVDYFPLSPHDRFELHLELLGQRLATGCDLLVLGNPGNPTGRVYSPELIRELYGLCRNRGVFLVIDEAFIDFCEQASSKYLAAGNHGVVVLRSMTKFYALPGLRLGYAIGAVGTIERLESLREPWSVNVLAQAAGRTVLADQEYAVETLQLIETEREWLLRALSALPGLRAYPSAANYLLLERLDGKPAAELAERLLVERLVIRDCANFQGLGDAFLRIAVRKREENERLMASLRSLL